MNGREPAASPVLVIGLVNSPSENETWVWDLLDDVEPRLRELIAMSDGTIPAPEWRRATTRHHRLGEALPEGRRVVLVTAAEQGEPRAGMTRWHCSPGRVTGVRQVAPHGPTRELPVEPYLIEERPIGEGLDLIRLPACPARRRRARRRVVAAALLGLLWDIVRETRSAPALQRIAA